MKTVDWITVVFCSAFLLFIILAHAFLEVKDRITKYKLEIAYLNLEISTLRLILKQEIGKKNENTKASEK